MPPRSKRRHSPSGVEGTGAAETGAESADANRGVSIPMEPPTLGLVDLPAPLLARVLRLLPAKDAIAFRAVSRAVHNCVGPSIEFLHMKGAALQRLDSTTAGATDVLRLKSLHIQGACRGAVTEAWPARVHRRVATARSERSTRAPRRARATRDTPRPPTIACRAVTCRRRAGAAGQPDVTAGGAGSPGAAVAGGCVRGSAA